MAMDDLLVWLVTAMGLTAVGFLLWTLSALIRDSGSARFAVERERPFPSLAPEDRGGA